MLLPFFGPRFPQIRNRPRRSNIGRTLALVCQYPQGGNLSTGSDAPRPFFRRASGEGRDQEISTARPVGCGISAGFLFDEGTPVRRARISA